jgi:hypothetical protein
METNPINNNTNASNTNNSTSNNQSNQNEQSNNQTNNNTQQNETLQGQGSNQSTIIKSTKPEFDVMGMLKEYLPHILSALGGMSGSYLTWVKPIKKDIDALNEEIDTLKSQQKKVKTEFEKVYERLEILEKKLKENSTGDKLTGNQPIKTIKDLEREKLFQQRKSIMLKDRLM